MQDSKSDSSFVVSHQLMRNISLSNVSDAGTIPSEDTEEVLRMRRFSAGKIPIYGNQLNYSYENLEARRKPSLDYKYLMSISYAFYLNFSKFIYFSNFFLNFFNFLKINSKTKKSIVRTFGEIN